MDGKAKPNSRHEMKPWLKPERLLGIYKGIINPGLFRSGFRLSTVWVWFFGVPPVFGERNNIVVSVLLGGRSLKEAVKNDVTQMSQPKRGSQKKIDAPMSLVQTAAHTGPPVSFSFERRCLPLQIAQPHRSLQAFGRWAAFVTGRIAPLPGQTERNSI